MEIIEITDFSDPNLDAFARLTERQLMNRDKPEDGLFIAESPLVIHRALDAGYEPVTLLMERKHIEGQAADVIARCGVPVYTAPLDVLERITGYKLTRGVLCSMRRKDLPTVEEVCKNARRIVVLEDVMNPTNVGAIFRSAAALGMDAVLLTPACSDPLYRRSARVSMGTVFQIPWTHIGERSPTGRTPASTACAPSASKPPPWRSRTIPSPSTIPPSSRRRSSPSSSAPRATVSPPKRSPTATIRSRSPCPTASTASTSPPPAR